MATKPAYKPSSAWYTTKMSGNGLYLDQWNPRSIKAYQTDRLWKITPQYENRPDLLAHDLYGDQNLWWVFQMRNIDIISDPLFDFVSGLEIYLPTLENLKTQIGTI